MITWPAKKVIGKIAVKNAVKIQEALVASINARQIVKDYFDTNPFDTKNPTQNRVMARAWALVNVRQNVTPLRKAVRQTVAEGWVTGEKFADSLMKKSLKNLKKNITIQDILNNPKPDVWTDWEPGDPATAALLERKYGLDILLNEADISIKNITKTQTDLIGSRLGDGISEGLSRDQIAKNIRDVVKNPADALRIAMTECSRASNVSAQNRYKEANLKQNQWMGIDPCPTCALNDGQIVDIDMPFNSGDTMPPAHPNCLCSLLPVISSSTFNDISDEVSDEAQVGYDFAKERDQYLTEQMIDIARSNDGEIKGLKFRLKTPKSISRKASKALADGEAKTVTEAIGKMTDINRFTIAWSDKNYLSGIQGTIDDLQKRGFGTRIKNYWARDDYKGINIAVMGKDGKEFELQLHTFESLKTKDTLHKYYEIYRESKNDAERWEYWDKMIKLAKEIPNPVDIQEIKKVGILKYEHFTDSIGNQRVGLANSYSEWLKLPPVPKPIGDKSSLILDVSKFKDYSETPKIFYEDNLKNQLFSGDHFKAIEGYQKNGYKAINSALRSDSVLEEGIKKNISFIKDAIEKAPPLKEDTVLYRAVKSGFDNFSPGQIFSDKGFLSTTARSDWAEGWKDKEINKDSFIIKIFAPSGSKGLIPNFVTADKTYANEYEFLFNAGQKFKILSVDKVKKIIEAMVI